MIRAFALAAALIATPALAATGDPLPRTGAVILDETFSDPAIYTRWDAGIGRYPDTFATRTQWAASERQLYVGNGFGGYGIEPIKVSWGFATITAKPFPPATLAKVKVDLAAYRAAKPSATLVTPERIAGLTHSSGMLGSKRTVPAIGTLVTFRAKLMGTTGFIPALWAYSYMPGVPVEIDLLERLPGWTAPDCFKSTAHSPWLKGGKVGVTTCLPAGTLTGRWHDFAYRITSDLDVVIYVDGREVNRFSVKSGGFSKAEMTLHVSLAAGWPGFPQPAKGALSRLMVDRVTARVAP